MSSTLVLVLGTLVVAVLLFGMAAIALLLIRKATTPKETYPAVDPRPRTDLPRPNAEE